MSGYRDTSSFDPNAAGDGPPMRPFNWLQRTGFAMIVLGALCLAATVVIRIAWHQTLKDDWIPVGSSLAILGSVLMSSRRQPGGLTSETKRKRMVIFAVALMVFGAGLITILVLKGA